MNEIIKHQIMKHHEDPFCAPLRKVLHLLRFDFVTPIIRIDRYVYTQNCYSCHLEFDQYNNYATSLSLSMFMY